MADDFGRVFGGPYRSLWVARDLRARTPAIKPMLAVFKQALPARKAFFAQADNRHL
jgi:hypothetical protein